MWRVSIETTSEAEEAVAELLDSVFQVWPSIYTDVETGRTTVSVFVKSAPVPGKIQRELRPGLSRLRACGIDPEPARLSIGRVRKQDWAESWKRHFKPFTVGSKLLVKPDWSRRNPARGQKTVVINPGLSFGTGQHPTTRFCLEQLVQARLANSKQSFLDIGTGSGILVIAAAKMGFRPAQGLDFDPLAVRVARENAKRNRVQVTIQRRDVTRPVSRARTFDVVCANLTADLLVDCAAAIERSVKAPGVLVLAGVLRPQFAEVIRTYERLGLSVFAENAEGEWHSGALRKSSD